MPCASGSIGSSATKNFACKKPRSFSSAVTAFDSFSAAARRFFVSSAPAVRTALSATAIFASSSATRSSQCSRASSFAFLASNSSNKPPTPDP